MCVKIIKDNITLDYDSKASFMSQVDGASEVLVNYQPNDKSIGKFLQELQKCADSGVEPKLNIRVDYNGFLSGYKVKKSLTKALNDISLNQIIKLMALSHSEADKRLEEISELCKNRECDVEKV